MPLLDKAEEIISAIEKDINMKKQWDRYKSNYPYAREYTWDSLMISIRSLSIDADLNIQKTS